jgi:L-2-amino-thiazoline-4-carboxylic acid hydrolase
MQKPEQGRYTANPEAATTALIKAFLDELGRRISELVQARTVIEAIQAQRAALEASHQDWIIDEPARYNLKMTAAVLAAYRALQDILPRAELLVLLREAFIGPFRTVMREGTAQMLDHAPDPFNAMVEISKSKETDAFGAGFTFEHERDDGQAYLLNVRRCFYHNFFVANGAPELTPIFCDFDVPWVEAINPARHGLRFERSTSIGYGGTMCPFHFYRTEREDRR